MVANNSNATVYVKCNNGFCNNLDTPGGKAYKLQCPKCGRTEFSVLQKGQYGGRDVTCRCGWKYNDFNDLCPKCCKNEALIIGIQPV